MSNITVTAVKQKCPDGALGKKNPSLTAFVRLKYQCTCKKSGLNFPTQGLIILSIRVTLVRVPSEFHSIDQI